MTTQTIEVTTKLNGVVLGVATYTVDPNVVPFSYEPANAVISWVTPTGKQSGTLSDFGKVDPSSVLQIVANNLKLTRLTLGNQLTKLVSLSCWLNQLTELDASGCPSLDSISLHNNMLVSVKLPPSVRTVDLASNAFTDGFPLGNLPKLSYLNLYNMPVGIPDISPCPAMYHVDFGANAGSTRAQIDALLTNLDRFNPSPLPQVSVMCYATAAPTPGLPAVASLLAKGAHLELDGLEQPS